MQRIARLRTNNDFNPKSRVSHENAPWLVRFNDVGGPALLLYLKLL